ncbi:hypothetical protein Taro_008873, partial [Colocasia esculenta]|nr:hypothetical protein [Colocasia esculenta]
RGSTREHIHVSTIICIYFLKGTSSKRKFHPKIYSYIHKYVLVCIYFLKEKSVQMGVPSRRIFVYSQKSCSYAENPYSFSKGKIHFQYQNSLCPKNRRRKYCIRISYRCIYSRPCYEMVFGLKLVLIRHLKFLTRCKCNIDSDRWRQGSSTRHPNRLMIKRHEIKEVQIKTRCTHQFHGYTIIRSLHCADPYFCLAGKLARPAI